MRNRRLVVVALLAALLGCGTELDRTGAYRSVGEARSPLARNVNPTLEEDERVGFAASQMAFALDLYRVVRQTTDGRRGDILLSPHSVSSVLAMAYAGAAGATKAEMRKAMRFDLPDDRLHTAFNALDLALAGRGAVRLDEDRERPFRLQVASSVWGMRGARFELSFLDRLATDYGAGVNTVDFGDKAMAAAAMNEWIESRTRGLVKQAIDPLSLSSATRMILINAVYFNAGWREKFEPLQTFPETFNDHDGGQRMVPTMHLAASLGYVETDDYEAFEMPYDGGEVSMIVVAPRMGRLEVVEDALTAPMISNLLASLKPTYIGLGLPKFNVDGTYDLKGPLQALGMYSAFATADFSGMAKEPTALTTVSHHTLAKVDEMGTEAVGVTIVHTGPSSSGPAAVPKRVAIDRPFIAAIIDRPTNTLLFVGRIAKPVQ